MWFFLTLGTSRQHEGVLDNIFSLSLSFSLHLSLGEQNCVCPTYTPLSHAWPGSDKSPCCVFRLEFLPQWEENRHCASASGGQHSICWRLAGKQHVLQHRVHHRRTKRRSVSSWLHVWGLSLSSDCGYRNPAFLISPSVEPALLVSSRISSNSSSS